MNVYIDPSFTTAEQLEATQAVQSWSQSLSGSPLYINVNFITSDPGANTSNTVRILNQPSGSPDSLAYTSYSASANSLITAATVSINRGRMFVSADGSSKLAYDPTLPSGAQFFTGTIAHEMGHVLGLADSGEDPCHGTSTSVMGPGCGTNNQGDGSSKPDPTSIAPTTCDKSTVLENIEHPLTNGSSANGGGGISSDTGGVLSGNGSKLVCHVWQDYDDGILMDYEACGD